MAKIVLGKTASGKTVYYDDKTSHAATHFADAPQLLALVRDFLATQHFASDEVFVDHDAGSIIGNTDLVEVQENDEIIYAKRVNRQGFTKFAKNRQPSPTSYFTVMLRKDAVGDYELVSTWIGRVCPSFPDDETATPQSKPFWDKHALAFGGQSVQEDTITDVCPW